MAILIIMIIFFFFGYQLGKAITFDKIIREEIKENDKSKS